MGNIHWQLNQHKNDRTSLPFEGDQEVNRAMDFHQSLPEYAPTPLYSLNSLATYLGLKDILVKDESCRFGLNSFKVLGSSYAIAQYLKPFSKIKSHPTQTFATATDGNHGAGLAWAAKKFNQNSVVYMPKGSSKYRLEKIQELGAQAEITTFNYDDTVRYVAELSQKCGWVLFQDTAWDGYTDIPKLIMQGYLTILGECIKQIKDMPSHIILQVGVGSFAAAIANGLKQRLGNSISIIVVEPIQADCLFQSASSNEGSAKKTKGNLNTIMAGLSCGEPSTLAWDILKKTVDCFVTCPDSTAAKGMRILGNPMAKDPRIVSGESGAVPLGLLFEICQNPLLRALKETINLNPSSKVLFINTEGDTDPENYRAICWESKF